MGDRDDDAIRETFIVNVADAPAYLHPAAGAVVMFEQLDQPFPEVGINIRILQPGQSNASYHSENQQEDFLVLGGHCTLILDGKEHELRAPRPRFSQISPDTVGPRVSRRAA